jgi:hypothetical protein
MRNGTSETSHSSSRLNGILSSHTSGMTHSWGTMSTPLYNLGYKPSLVERYQSFVAKNMIRMLHYVCPWTDVMKANKGATHAENGGGESAAAGLQFSLEKNFGELEFDWEERVVRLRAIGENSAAPPLLMAQYSMDQLAGRAPASFHGLPPDDFALESSTVRHSLYESDWVCLNHRGRDSPLSHMLGHASSAVALILLVPLPLLLPAFFSLILIRRWSLKAVPPVMDSRSWNHQRKSSLKNDGSKAKVTPWIRLSELIPFRFKTFISIAKHRD